MSSNQQRERTGVFEKNIFLGVLGQKDPKWALKETFEWYYELC